MEEYDISTTVEKLNNALPNEKFSPFKIVKNKYLDILCRYTCTKSLPVSLEMFIQKLDPDEIKTFESLCCKGDYIKIDKFIGQKLDKLYQEYLGNKRKDIKTVIKSLKDIYYTILLHYQDYEYIFPASISEFMYILDSGERSYLSQMDNKHIY